MKKYLGAILLLGLSGMLFPAATQARDDWELWSEIRLKKPLSESLTLQGVFSARFRDDMGEFYKNFEEIGLSLKLADWLKTEGAYHFDYSERPKTQDSVIEHRPYVSLIPQVKIGIFNVENRNRIEYRHPNGVTSDDWRYRNRSKASFSLGEGQWYRMKPFVADEFFYGFRAGEIQKNRVLLGFEKPVTESISVEIYYVLESNRTGKDWKEFHALGIAATFQL